MTAELVQGIVASGATAAGRSTRSRRRAPLRLADVVLSQPRWRAWLTFVTVMGGVGGAAPVAFLGAGRPTGLLAGATLGIAAAGFSAPVWLITPLVVTLTLEEESGVAALRVVNGTSVRRIRAEALLTAALLTGCGVGLAAVAGVAGAATSSTAPGELALGFERGASLSTLALALGATAYAASICVVAALLTGRRAPASVALRAVLLATGALLAVAYFAPAVGWIAGFSPWAPVWPLTTDLLGTPLLALDASVAQRATVAVGWLAFGAFTTARSLRRRSLASVNREST